MACLNFDNFDAGGPLNEDYGYVQGATINAGTGIGGTSSLRTTAAKTDGLNNGVYEGFASTSRSGYKGIWSNFSVSGASDSAVISVWQGDSFLELRPVGTSLDIWTVNSGVIHTESSAISPGTFKRIDLAWTVSTLDAGNALNYDGSIELKINDVVEFTTTGIRLGFALPVGFVRDVQWNVVVFNPHGDGDKHYLNDGSGTDNNSYMPANVNIYVQRPTSDGSFEELTPSSGTNSYAMVDDTAHDGNTTYLSCEEAALKSTFNFADFSSIGSQLVYGLKHLANGKKSDGGYRRFRPLSVRAGAQQFAPKDYPVGIGYFSWQQHVWERDPFTGQRWLVPNINVTEFGTLVG